MSIDSEGRVTTYKAKCSNYSPDKNRPTEVVDQKLGQTYRCSEFEYSPKKDRTGLWKKQAEAGDELCFVCKNYKELRSKNLYETNINPKDSDWYICYMSGKRTIMNYNHHNKFWTDLEGKPYEPYKIEKWLNDKNSQ